MNYYPYHIGDFRAGTVNMTRLERWIYGDMMDMYYDTEKPLPLDLTALCDGIGVRQQEEKDIVSYLLRIKFQKTEQGYQNERADREIRAYHDKADIAKENGKRGGRPKKPNPNPEKPSGFQSGSNPVQFANPDLTGSEANQEPITKNHKPVANNQGKSKPLASPEMKIPEDFEKFWNAYPQRPGASKPDALKQWKARIKAGSSVDEILDGVMRYASFVSAAGTEPQYIKQPSTFLGVGLHFKAEWPIAQARASPAGYLTPNEKARDFADRLTGRKKNDQLTIIDINPEPP